MYMYCGDVLLPWSCIVVTCCWHEHVYCWRVVAMVMYCVDVLLPWSCIMVTCCWHDVLWWRIVAMIMYCGDVLLPWSCSMGTCCWHDHVLWWRAVAMIMYCGDVLLSRTCIVVTCCCHDHVLWLCFVACSYDHVSWWRAVSMMMYCGDVLLPWSCIVVCPVAMIMHRGRASFLLPFLYNLLCYGWCIVMWCCRLFGQDVWTNIQRSQVYSRPWYATEVLSSWLQPECWTALGIHGSGRPRTSCPVLHGQDRGDLAVWPRRCTAIEVHSIDELDWVTRMWWVTVVWIVWHM
jgi:hypothetical protein